MNRKEKRRQPSMRWRMIGIMLICWMIPFAFLIGIMGVYLASNHSGTTARNFCEQLEFNNQVCVERLNAAIAASRQASYDGDLLGANENWAGGGMTYLQAGRVYKSYLAEKFQKNDAVSSAVLWFENDRNSYDTGPVFYSTYNEHAGGTFQQIRAYQEEDHEAVSAYAEHLETGIGFLKRGKKLYLIRNLINSRFQRRGTLVFCLNQNYCFSSLSEYPMAAGIYTEINGERLDLIPNERLLEWGTEELPAETGSQWISDRLFVTDDQRGDNYSMHTYMLLEKEVTRYPFYGYQYILAGMVLSLIPMLVLMLYVFRRQVTNPIAILSDGSKRIEDGDLGYQIEEPMNSAEFSYLKDSFNEMSARMKRQFDRIYQEEVALREARIMALQSHINPHFMNNTLEIINWEARLAGNQKVSKMIEALGTMFDAAMDRRKRPEVRLSEEMGYVNSYLYITKERLGKRLTVEIEIPDELTDYYVPRLILQPVIENAVEHGVVPNGSGVVKILGSRSEQHLYLEIINDGGLSEEDRKRIARLLDPDYNTGKEPAGNLGIANVNQRLRILYGEPCGLTIEEREEGRTTARLTMPLVAQPSDSV